MACCNVNRCCCCIEHTLGVKLLALFDILCGAAYVLVTIQLAPDFITYVGVAVAFGIFSNILLLVAVYRVQRWFCIPWLIYVMLVVVALCLISVLQVVISLGASKADPDWPEIIAVSVGCLGLAGMYLYFWIVVLELFIKIGPLYYMTPGAHPPPPGQFPGLPPGQPITHQPHPTMQMMSPYLGQPMQGQALAGGAAPPVPVHAVVYDHTQVDGGPQSMFAGQIPGGGQQTAVMYQAQPNSLPPVFYQTNVRQY